MMRIDACDVFAKRILLFCICIVLCSCASNPFLQGYKFRTAEQEHEMLIPHSIARADEIFVAKKALIAEPLSPAAVAGVTQAYADFAEEIDDRNDQLYKYCLGAAGYELKLFKAKGGALTPRVIAETGRNLYLRNRGCKAERWLQKALVIDMRLGGEYQPYLDKSKAACAAVGE